MFTNPDFQPFYVGQKVVGSDSVLPGSRIKKGYPYVISHCEFKINPSNGTGPYWYVGVQGCDHDWMTPRLFTPLEEHFLSISFEKCLEMEQPLISVN